MSSNVETMGMCHSCLFFIFNFFYAHFVILLKSELYLYLDSVFYCICAIQDQDVPEVVDDSAYTEIHGQTRTSVPAIPGLYFYLLLLTYNGASALWSVCPYQNREQHIIFYQRIPRILRR